MKSEIKVVVPKGAFGGSSLDNELDTALRNIAVGSSPNSEMEWADKYGTDFESETFMMHPFCWCDEDDCPWCTGCYCPESAFHHFVDGKEVSLDEWVNFFKREVDGKVSSLDHSEWMKLAGEVNKRRTTSHDLECDFCKTGGTAESKGGEAGRPAPNFWYKPTNFKVWWYKYIGRNKETNRVVSKEEIKRIAEHCLSVGKEER